MSAILCPDCGLPMVWMQNRWRCQCRRMIEEERTLPTLHLQAVVHLPEVMLRTEAVQEAERLVEAYGFRCLDEWTYRADLHAVTVWVDPLTEGS